MCLSFNRKSLEISKVPYFYVVFPPERLRRWRKRALVTVVGAAGKLNLHLKKTQDKEIGRGKAPSSHTARKRDSKLCEFEVITMFNR